MGKIFGIDWPFGRKKQEPQHKYQCKVCLREYPESELTRQTIEMVHPMGFNNNRWLRYWSLTICEDCNLEVISKQKKEELQDQKDKAAIIKATFPKSFKKRKKSSLERKLP